MSNGILTGQAVPQSGQSQMAFILILTHPKIELEPCSNGALPLKSGGMRFRLDQGVDFFLNAIALVTQSLSHKKGCLTVSQKIEDYRFGRITISGRTYTKDVLIFPDRVVANWRREHGHTLSLGDLQQVLDAKPEALVIGRGAFKRMRIPSHVRCQVEAQGIEVNSQSTEKACQAYNHLRDKKNVIAALHLAC